MTDKRDPRKDHPAFERTEPPPAPAKLRPPRGSVFTRDELPTKPRNLVPPPLPPLPEKKPVTVSRVEELLDAAFEDFEERTGINKADPNAPKAAKAAHVVITSLPEKDRKPVVLTAIICGALLIAYAMHLGLLPGISIHK